MKGLSRRVLFESALIAAVALSQADGALAAGFGKKKPCTTCPGGEVITVVPSTTEATPMEPTPMDPAAPPATTEAMEDAFTAPYQVASASEFAAPNFIGDFLGSDQTTIGTSPGTGGGVGRMKFTENTSILPVDRVYFGYQWYTNSPLLVGAGGGDTNVNRFTPGFEKTFFNGQTSIEVRVPFAGTVSGDQNVDSLGAYDLQLGNVTLFFKALLLQTDTFAIGSGLSVSTPTADDTLLTNGVGQIGIENSGTHLAPYLGVIWNPGRLFSQFYGQYDFDVSSRDVVGRFGSGGSFSQDINFGGYSDPDMYFLDWNAGYWIYRESACRSFLTGIAPVVELHYNQSIGGSDVVFNDIQTVAAVDSTVGILNITLGTHFEFNERTVLTLGAGLPLLDGNNRQSDFELNVFLNHRFGRFATSRRTPPTF